MLFVGLIRPTRNLTVKIERLNLRCPAKLWSMICRHCRDNIPGDCRFCPHCGIGTETDVAAKRPWFWICVILLFALIWAIFAVEKLGMHGVGTP